MAERVLEGGQTLEVVLNGETVLTVTCGAGSSSTSSNNVNNGNNANGSNETKPFVSTGGKRSTRKNRKEMEGGAKKKTGKRAPNKYMEFCAKHRKDVMAAHPDWDVTKVARELGRMYRERKSE